jgi:hypothetical protein
LPDAPEEQGAFTGGEETHQRKYLSLQSVKLQTKHLTRGKTDLPHSSPNQGKMWQTIYSIQRQMKDI